VADAVIKARRTCGLQPRIAHTRDLRAVTPRPLAVLLQVVALDLPPIGQFDDIGADTVGELRSAAICVSYMPSLKAK